MPSGWRVWLKVCHADHERLSHTIRVYVRSQLFTNSRVDYFTCHKNQQWKSCGMGPTVFCPYPRRLEDLTICRCHNKGFTFSSVDLHFKTLSVGPARVWTCDLALGRPVLIQNELTMHTADSLPFPVIPCKKACLWLQFERFVYHFTSLLITWPGKVL